jgi:hypothetical protein
MKRGSSRIFARHRQLGLGLEQKLVVEKPLSESKNQS